MGFVRSNHRPVIPVPHGRTVHSHKIPFQSSFPGSRCQSTAGPPQPYPRRAGGRRARSSSTTTTQQASIALGTSTDGIRHPHSPAPTPVRMDHHRFTGSRSRPRFTDDSTRARARAPPLGTPPMNQPHLAHSSSASIGARQPGAPAHPPSTAVTDSAQGRQPPAPADTYAHPVGYSPFPVPSVPR